MMTNTKKIGPKDQDAVVQSLQVDVVSRSGKHLIQVKRVRKLEAPIKDVETGREVSETLHHSQ